MDVLINHQFNWVVLLRKRKEDIKKGITSFICRPKEVKTFTDEYSSNTTKSTSDKCLDVVYC